MIAFKCDFVIEYNDEHVSQKKGLFSADSISMDIKLPIKLC